VNLRSLDELNRWGKDSLPGLIGFEITAIEPGRLNARMEVRRELLAPHGFLHAASVIALADSACGYGTMYDLPEDVRTFTTIELKTNFLGTAREGVVTCEATRVHGGRTTQVWDANVRNEAGKTIALFRCTQILLR
jgi:1,4-dihydroxy-2-naphthoyl-CoA hydrolase